MNQAEHLTENQLTDYLGNLSLEREAKHRIGRHLLQCDFCLKRLPQPTAEQFWAALMTETDEDEESPDQITAWAARLGSIFQSFKQPKIFALSAAALAILIFFSAFIWLGAAKSSEMENVIAQNHEPAQTVFDQIGNEQTNLPSALPIVETGDSSSPTAMTSVTARREMVAAANNNAPKNKLKPMPRNDFNLKTAAKSADSEKPSISSTRGGSIGLPNCGGEVEMTNGTNGRAVALKWKKIQNAAKYHLYVSDDEEILLDEFETSEATSYVLKKPLDPLKTYKWKIVVTLENGETVIGDSQKFTVKDLKSDQKKSKKKEKSDIRCSEDK